MKKFILAVSTLTVVAGCGDKPSNLAYVKPHTTVVDKPVPIKEIVGTNQIDILWIIDNSGSMMEYQQSVIDNMDTFINSLTAYSALNWKSGLISTSENEPPFGGFEKGDEWFYSDVDIASKMKQAVRDLGLGGDVTEKVFTPVLKQLKRYPNFLRPRAALAVIAITDAEEQSRMSPDDFVKQLVALKGDPHKVYAYGFVTPQDWGCTSTDGSFDWPGSPYERVNAQLQGHFYKLCDDKFADNLTDLGQDIGKQINQSRLYLKELPRIASLKVMYRDQELPAGPKPTGYWIYRADLNAIEFNDLSFAPGDTEEVRVYYEVDNGFE